MSHRKFSASSPWVRYSKKLAQKIEKPFHAGSFTVEEATMRNMRLVTGQEGVYEEGNCITLYWLVDESDGVIADAKFQVFGQSALIGAAEVACELLIRKNYDQARHFSAETIDKGARDKEGNFAFPSETFGHVNLVLGAIENAAEKCFDIAFIESYVPTPIRAKTDTETGTYPGWKELSVDQKLRVIEDVIAVDIRPYIELDAGGVRVVNLVNENELIIAYEGACTSCYSATGATLDAIGQVLRSKVDPDLVVIPDIASLQRGDLS